MWHHKARVGGIDLKLKTYLRDLVASGLFRSSLTDLKRLRNDRLYIATFHRVLPEKHRVTHPFSNLIVSPDELFWFLSFFRRVFELGTLDGTLKQLRSGEPRKQPLMAVTFDDGQVDNYLHALPVLEALGAKATFFVTTQASSCQFPLWHDRIAYIVAGTDSSVINDLLLNHGFSQILPNESRREYARRIVREAKPWSAARLRGFLRDIDALGMQHLYPSWDGLMTVENLRELFRRGHEIGCHTESHMLLPNCSDEELRQEVFDSRQVLQEELDAEISSFCFPSGAHDERTCAAVKRAGYRQAVVTRWGSNSLVDDPMALRRFDVTAANFSNRHGCLSEARTAWNISSIAPQVLF